MSPNRFSMGVDLSYTGTGITIWAGDHALEGIIIRTGAHDFESEQERQRFIAREVVKVWKRYDPTILAIEEYAYQGGRNFNNVARLAELGGVVKYFLWKAGAGWVTYTATTVKKYATGNGRASKVMMVMAAKKWMELPDDNVADACHIARLAWEEYV